MPSRRTPAVKPTRNLKNLLPVKLRIEVRKSIRHLPTLRNLIIASLADQTIFRTYFFEIWGPIVREKAYEIRICISDMLCHRLSLAPDSRFLAKKLQAYINRIRWPALGIYCGNDPVAIVFYVAE